MKVLTSFLGFCLLILVTSSCSKLEISAIEKASPEKDYKAYLSFDSPDALRALIEGEEGVVTRSAVQRLNEKFISLLDHKTSTTRSSDDEDYYVSSGYDTLVPNERFAALLNTRGEICVDNMLYRINADGTYFFDAELQDYVDASITSFAQIQGEEISENLYQIEEKIFRYNTFAPSENELESEGFSYDDSFLIDDEEDETPDSRAISARVVPLANFSTYNAKGKTALGKLLAGIFGGNSKYEHEFIHKKRRLQGSFYDYNYVVYSELGVLGKMQKKNFIGWSETKADEIVIGWSEMIFETNLDIRNTLTPPRTPMYVGSTTTLIPGFNRKGICLTILGLDITNANFQKALKAGIVPLMTWLRSNVSMNIDKADALAVVNNQKVVYIVPQQELRFGDVKEKRIVFASDFHMVFSLGLSTTPLEYKQFLQKTLEASMKVPVIHVKSGSVYVAGRIGEAWGGVKIIKK
jgi:hypothetical protein